MTPLRVLESARAVVRIVGRAAAVHGIRGGGIGVNSGNGTAMPRRRWL